MTELRAVRSPAVEREVRIHCMEHADRIRVIAVGEDGLFYPYLADLAEPLRDHYIDFFASRGAKPAIDRALTQSAGHGV